MIGHFHRYVTERLLNAKVVVFLGFLWFAVGFLHKKCDWLEKMYLYMIYSLEKVYWFGVIRWKKCNFASERIWLHYAQKENRNIFS